MSKVLVTADLHVHPHRGDPRRVEDGLECLKWIYSTARTAACEHLILVGDFLHNRFNLPTYAYSKACKIVSQNKDVKTIFLLGNHDMFYEDKWDVHSLTPLQEWATVIDTPQTLKINDISVDFLPYTPKPSLHLAHFTQPSDVLFAHVSVAEALLNKKYDVLSVEDDSKEKEVISPKAFDRWKKTWLGHYHYGQVIRDGVEYIGSPMQLTFGEAGQTKHVAIFDLATLETVYVDNDKSPKFHIIDDPADVDSIDVTDSYVKFRCEAGGIESKFEVRKKLSKLGAREIEFERQPIDVAEKASAALTNIAALFSNKPQLIDHYVDGIEIPEHLQIEIVKKIGLELVTM